MNEEKLLERITINPKILGGKPIIRGRRLAVEHILGMLALLTEMVLNTDQGLILFTNAGLDRTRCRPGRPLPPT